MRSFLKITRLILAFFIFFAFLSGCNLFGENTSIEPDYRISIPVYGNSWLVNNPTESDQIIQQDGISGWSEPDDLIRTYFRIDTVGQISLAIRAKVESGHSLIKCTFNGKGIDLHLSGNEFNILDLGSFQIKTKGYYYLELQGIAKSSSEFGKVTDVMIGGEVASGPIYYVKDDFYWGRRGPSVHLNYEIPSDAGQVLWFYNEMTIPEGNDVLGSYFMANGFGEGYFGIQVNSLTERRILFSVWSPFKTDDPKAIPDDHKITMLRKGVDVYSGEFGNEGSGGQSYRKFIWKAGSKYCFLLKGMPSENNSTDFTAYFLAPEIGHWELIASFRRPQTSTSLKRLHSFLENFNPEMGCVTRQVVYTNQWVCNAEGQWTELTKAKFTVDATARKNSRLDYAGGSADQNFYLKNCGFFSEKVNFDIWQNRFPTGIAPGINFSELP